MKAKIRIVEEIPTVVFAANNNLDFLIFLHNTNNRKNIKKSSFCFFLILNIIFKYFTLFWILLLYSIFREAGKGSLVIISKRISSSFLFQMKFGTCLSIMFWEKINAGNIYRNINAGNKYRKYLQEWRIRHKELFFDVFAMIWIV